MIIILIVRIAIIIIIINRIKIKIIKMTNIKIKIFQIIINNNLKFIIKINCEYWKQVNFTNWLKASPFNFLFKNF